MGQWKAFKKSSGTGWKELEHEAGSGWKALEWESAYEDFTTFTEVDTPENRIQFTANHIDFNPGRADTCYLYKDYGAAHFGNFTHKIKARYISCAGYGLGIIWQLANDLGTWQGLYDNSRTHILLRIYNGYLSLEEGYNHNFYSDSFNPTASTWYYIKIVKSGTSLNAYIYSDTGYSNLVDTLTITLHGNWTFKYLYGCDSYGSVGSGEQIVCDIENFDIGE